MKLSLTNSLCTSQCNIVGKIKLFSSHLHKVSTTLHYIVYELHVTKDIPRLRTRGRVPRGLEGLVGVWTCLLEVHEINKITLKKIKKKKKR